MNEKRKFKQVLLLYHVEERELVINKMMKACLIDACLAEEVIILQAQNAFENIYLYNPDLIISFFPRDDYPTQILSMIKYYYRCVFVAVPNEQYVNLNDERMGVIFGHNRIPHNLVDYCLFWGPGIMKCGTDYLIKTNKLASRDRAYLMGYFPYELDFARKYYAKSSQLETIKEKQREYRKTIMIVTAVMARDWKYEDFLEQSAVDLSDPSSVEATKNQVYSMNYYIHKYLDIIDLLVNKQSDYLFLIKLHPIDINIMNDSHEGSKRYDGLRHKMNVVLIDEPNPISQYMDNVDLFIHYGSTSSMEAFIHGIPTILLSNDCSVHAENTYGSTVHNGGDMVIAVSKAEDILEAIDNPLEVSNDSLVAKNAYSIMNYKQEYRYEPSKWFIASIREMDCPQMLDIHDDDTLDKINGPGARRMRKHYFFDSLRAIMRFDFKTAVKIYRFLLVFRSVRSYE